MSVKKNRVIRMTDEVYEELKARSEATNKYVSTYVNDIIEEHIKDENDENSIRYFYYLNGIKNALEEISEMTNELETLTLLQEIYEEIKKQGGVNYGS